MVHTTASSQVIPEDEKNMPSLECCCAYSSTLLHSRISFTKPFPATLCSLDTRYDSPGRTCRATHASDATTLRRHVISSGVHLSVPRRFTPMSIGRIFSVLSLAVTVMLSVSSWTTSFPQNRKGATFLSRTEKVSIGSLPWHARSPRGCRTAGHQHSKT